MNLDYLQLNNDFFEINNPSPLEEPYLIHFNSSLANKLGFSNDTSFVKILNSEKKLNNKYFSMVYAGFQFGNYAPILGDGRVHNIDKREGYNLQLKGSGETLYSKMADGRCSLDSSIREYLMSEAMYHLGVPTSRAVGIIGSNTNIVRNNIEKASIIMRASSSWIRFGSFEYFYYMKEYDKLKELLDYTIDESFPHLKNSDDKYFKMFCEVVDKTAITLAKWQALGFCHGVLNTDNISIEGLTIDYGPFAMMDEFKYGFVCNKSDKAGRYAYGEQVNIMYWNLTKLSIALSPHIDKEKMDKKLDEFGRSLYFDIYLNEMQEKLGLFVKHDDSELIEDLIITLNSAGVDYTKFFRVLSHYNGDRMPLYEISMDPIVVDKWLDKYDKRLELETLSSEERFKYMLKKNPKYILKNYMLDLAIKKAKQNDFSMIDVLFQIAQNPYDELEEYEHFTGDIPEEYSDFILSCSS